MKKHGKGCFALILTLVLLLGVAVGGTLAYLISKTEPVVNTFSPSDISITLTESRDLDLKLVPGKTITKDPEVTVKAGSEACWLFVKVEESSNVPDFLTYSVDSSWTALSGVSGVYYIWVSAADAEAGVGYPVLTDDCATVKSTVTKADLGALTSATYPKLTFTAYAIQSEGFSSASAAWAAIQ